MCIIKIQSPSNNHTFTFWLSNKGTTKKGERIDSVTVRVPSKNIFPLAWHCWTKKEAQKLAKEYDCLQKDVKKVYSKFSVGYVVWNKENRILLDNGQWVDTHF